LNRQPAAGRANNGGLRIGEMERDSIIGHGISHFLNESVMERSDGCKVQIDGKTGLISNYDENEKDKKYVNIPYSMKLLLQELQTLCIAPRLVTKETITNKPVFNYLYKNVSKYSVTHDFLNDFEEEETSLEDDTNPF